MKKLFWLMVLLLGLAVPAEAQVSGGGSGGNGNATSISNLPLCALTDPNADRILFWDDSAGCYTHLTVGGGLLISGTTLSASGGAGSGDVVGPASATDNAIVRFDLTGGKLIQNSGITIDDSNNMSGTVAMTFATAGVIQTGVSAADAIVFKARDVDGASYTTFATLTANNTPTFDLSSAVTAGGSLLATAAKDLSFFAATTSAQLAGVISNETGSGLLVFATSPALTTPSLGVATATSINGLTITSSTGTLTITNAKVVSVSNTLTFTGTDSSSVAFGGGGTVAYTANNLSVFAATSSSQLAGVLSDETGSGLVVFGTTPTLGVPLMNGWREAFAAKTADYTVTSSDSFVSCDATGGTVTLTLPTAASISGRNYTFKKIDSSANACVIDGNAAETIDGAATYVIAQQNDAVTVIATASTTWNIRNAAGFALTDPNADRIVFWDDSAGHLDWLTVSGCSITGTTLTCSGSGDVTAAAAFNNDNRLIRSDGAAKGVQASGVTLDDTDNMSAIGSLQLVTGGALRTAQSAGNTLLVQAYDVDGTSFTTFITCTANNTPTCDLSSSVTLNGVSLVSSSSTNTLTNKTIDAEGTGNTITIPVFMSFRAAVCQNATASLSFDTPTSNPAVAACVTGTNTQFGVADFATASDLSVQGHFTLPSDWNGGNIDFSGKWFSSTTSGNVVWIISAVCVADAETSDPSFNTADNITEATKGTANQQNDIPATTLTNGVTGCAAGEEFYFKIRRNAGAGSDTMSGTARLVEAAFKFRRAM